MRFGQGSTPWMPAATTAPSRTTSAAWKNATGRRPSTWAAATSATGTSASDAPPRRPLAAPGKMSHLCGRFGGSNRAAPHLEKCQSGRMGLTRNQVCPQGYRGFESLFLRLTLGIFLGFFICL